MGVLNVMVGFILGYLTISICESFFHRYIQHAPKTVRELYLRLGGLGAALQKAWYAHHVVHHYRTFRHGHTLQFKDSKEKTRLDEMLANRERHDVVETDYGVRIGAKPSEFLKYIGPTLPIFLVICIIGGPLFTLGALIPFAALPLFAEFVHPYLHMRHELVAKDAPLHARILSRTAYFKWLAIHHWMHHRYEHCNYNLLLGGDVILGVQRYPGPADWQGMQKAGLWTPSWSRTQT